MACYKVATGNWNAANAWASSSGGTGGSASTPTSSDDAIFDANTPAGTHTFNVAWACKNLDITKPASGTHTFSGTQSGTIEGDLIIRSTSNVVFSNSGIMSGHATSGSHTITTNGIVLSAQFQIDAAGGSYSFADAFNSTSSFALRQGTFSTANKAMTISGGFSAADNGLAKSLSLGSSAIDCGGTTFTDTTASMTFDAGTSSITNRSSMVDATGHTYYDMTMVLNGTFNMPTANCSFHTLSVQTASSTRICRCRANYTCTTFSTTDANGRPIITSDTIGVQRTITAANVSLSGGVVFQDINGAGAGTWSGTYVGDAGGNSGITFRTPATLTQQLSGNWVGGTIWAERVEYPLPQDTAVLTAGAGNLTGLPPFACKDLNATNHDGTLTLGSGSGICGNITFGAGETVAGSGIFTIYGRSTHSITSNGKSFPSNVTQAGPGGTYTLQDNATLGTTATYTHTQGTLALNGKTLSTGLFSSAGALTRAITGSGTIAITGVGTAWDTSTITGLTVTGSPVIKFTDSSASAKTFAGGGISGVQLWNACGSTGTFTVSGANTFDLLKWDAGRDMTLTASVTQALASASAFQPQGTSGSHCSLKSTGAAATISCAAGVVSASYLDIDHSTGGGGASFIARTALGCTDNGNNTTWRFNDITADASMAITALAESGAAAASIAASASMTLAAESVSGACAVTISGAAALTMDAETVAGAGASAVAANAGLSLAAQTVSGAAQAAIGANANTVVGLTVQSAGTVLIAAAAGIQVEDIDLDSVGHLFAYSPAWALTARRRNFALTAERRRYDLIAQ